MELRVAAPCGSRALARETALGGERLTLTSVTEHHASRSLDAEQAAAIGQALVELRPQLHDTVAALTVSKGRHNQYLLGWKERGEQFGLLFDPDELRDAEVIQRRLLAARRYKLPPEPDPPALKPALQFNARGDARPIVHWDFEQAAEDFAHTVAPQAEEEAMPDTTVNGPGSQEAQNTAPLAQALSLPVEVAAGVLYERLGTTGDGRPIVALNSAALQAFQSSLSEQVSSALQALLAV